MKPGSDNVQKSFTFVYLQSDDMQTSCDATVIAQHLDHEITGTCVASSSVFIKVCQIAPHSKDAIFYRWNVSTVWSLCIVLQRGYTVLLVHTEAMIDQ